MFFKLTQRRYAAATFACVGLGWLAGPILGNQVWRLTHRNLLAVMESKDKEFYRHIVKNRVNPSRQSVSNPVPDYYCEKVGSLKQYRQWLVKFFFFFFKLFWVTSVVGWEEGVGTVRLLSWILMLYPNSDIG